jgi:zinc/manganese transport system permease protein
MSDLLELMAAPFAACVVLVGIHAYLGMHVIQRKVIFVDLALAQIAALGATFSFLLGMSPHGRGAYFFALGFAIAGAAIFSLTRMRTERVPQEAIIGIVYAVALASAILVADRAPEGAEHIKETMVGAVLWVTWPTIIKTAVIYALVGALHVALRKRFFQISFEPEKAYAEKRWVRLWDFIFYITFAFVITSSVAIAGVLLVFTFLVIPAVIATLFATKIAARLALGWSVGIVACLVGMVASYRFDMPSGPTVVGSLGIALVLAGLVYYIRAAEHRMSAFVKVAAAVVVVAVVLASLAVFVTSGTFMHIAHEHDWEQESDAGGPDDPDLGAWLAIDHDCAGDPACMAGHLAQRGDWARLLREHLVAVDPAERELALDVLAGIDDAARLDLLAEAAAGETDGLLRLKEAQLLLDAGDRRGFSVALGLLEEEFPFLVRDDAHQLLLEGSGRSFGYDPLASAAENEVPLARWREWVDQAM